MTHNHGHKNVRRSTSNAVIRRSLSTFNIFFHKFYMAQLGIYTNFFLLKLLMKLHEVYFQIWFR